MPTKSAQPQLPHGHQTAPKELCSALVRSERSESSIMRPAQQEGGISGDGLPFPIPVFCFETQHERFFSNEEKTCCKTRWSESTVCSRYCVSFKDLINASVAEWNLFNEAKLSFPISEMIRWRRTSHGGLGTRPMVAYHMPVLMRR